MPHRHLYARWFHHISRAMFGARRSTVLFHVYVRFECDINKTITAVAAAAGTILVVVTIKTEIRIWFMNGNNKTTINEYLMMTLDECLSFASFLSLFPFTRIGDNSRLDMIKLNWSHCPSVVIILKSNGAICFKINGLNETYYCTLIYFHCH